MTGRNPNSTLEENLEEKSNYLEKVRSMREEIERQKLAEEMRLKSEKMKIEAQKEEKRKEKLRKEFAKEERVRKQKKMKQHWEMLRWVTDFMEMNQMKWEEERIKKMEENGEEIRRWERMKRIEKIEKLKNPQKYKEQVDPEGKRIQKSKKAEDMARGWKVWRAVGSGSPPPTPQVTRPPTMQPGSPCRR